MVLSINYILGKLFSFTLYTEVKINKYHDLTKYKTD